MKFLAIGRSETLFETIKTLTNVGHQLCGIITSKAAPEYTVDVQGFSRLSSELNVPFLEVGFKDQQRIESFISHTAPEIGISFNHISVVNDATINLLPLGILNAHCGDLPRFRGNACPAWAILNGEKRVGLCVHKMVGGELDSGDIIVREYLSISQATRVGEIVEWMNQRVPHLFLQALENLTTDRDYILEPQSKNPTDSLRCYPRNPDDGYIDWNQSAESILRLINASSEPYAGAYCEYKNKRLRIWRAQLAVVKSPYLAIPGQILGQDGSSVIVACDPGALKITEVSVDEKEASRLPTDHIHGIRNRLK